MTVLWSTFTREVLPAVPGCPVTVAENAIRSAVIHLCQRSRVWREDLSAINVVLGTAAYVLTPPSETRIIEAINVTYDSETIDPEIEEDLDYIYYDWRTLPDGTPSKYLFMTPQNLTLNRKPEENITGGLEVRVAVKPTVDATGCDDLIRNDWIEVVADGAISKLMDIPGKPWSNEKSAKKHEKSFRKGVARARINMVHGRTGKQLTARPVSF